MFRAPSLHPHWTLRPLRPSGQSLGCPTCRTCPPTSRVCVWTERTWNWRSTLRAWTSLGWTGSVTISNYISRKIFIMDWSHIHFCLSSLHFNPDAAEVDKWVALEPGTIRGYVHWACLLGSKYECDCSLVSFQTYLILSKLHSEHKQTHSPYLFFVLLSTVKASPASHGTFVL